MKQKRVNKQQGIKCPINDKNAAILRVLLHLNSKERKNLINACDRDFIKCVCECSYNILNGNVPLNNKEKSNLAKHANILRKLVQSDKGIANKKKIIIQKGGAFLPNLLTPILFTVLDNFLTK